MKPLQTFNGICSISADSQVIRWLTGDLKWIRWFQLKTICNYFNTSCSNNELHETTIITYRHHISWLIWYQMILRKITHAMLILSFCWGLGQIRGWDSWNRYLQICNGISSISADLMTRWLLGDVKWIRWLSGNWKQIRWLSDAFNWKRM